MQDLSDTGVPVGTTGLIQIQDLSDIGLIRYRTYQIQDLSDAGLIKYRSTRRYYRTYSETELSQRQEYP